MTINDSAFRSYDIRGIYNDTINNDFAYLLGLTFGNMLKNQNKDRTVVGYDNRASSPALHEKLLLGLTDSGINVINLGLVTSPMYYFSWTLFNIDSGIMITASHNPKEYNGFKISFNGLYNVFGDDIQKIKEEMRKEQQTSINKGIVYNKYINDDYVKYILKDIKLNKRLKVVIDSGNGTSSIIVDKIFNNLNIEYIPIFTDSDSEFPNHHPDPSVLKNLKDLSEKVIETKADVGFAFDGDADRIGMVDQNGNIIPVDHIMIIIIRNILNDLKDKRILYDVKCSNSLKDEIIKLGGIPIENRTGNSYQQKEIKKEGILFGGELSGHIFFNDKFPGYDDGIYVALRLMEILSNTDKKTNELLDRISKYYSTPEIKVATNEIRKFEIVEEIKKYCIQKQYKYLDIDGCKVIFDDGFALIRASNTGPDLTLRFEAKTEERLNQIKYEFETKIKEMLN